MSANEDLRREMEAHLNNQQATNVGDVAEAQAVEAAGGGAEEDPLLEAMTQAVNPDPQYLGDEGHGTGTGATKTTPPTTGLNWGPDGDEQLTNWLNNMN